MLTLDGQVGFALKRADTVEIRRAAARTRLLRLPAEALLHRPPHQAQVGRALSDRLAGRRRRRHGSGMLRELRVRNLAVIEEAVVPLAPGLNVLSGETGAGKSILIDAILLVVGGARAARPHPLGSRQRRGRGASSRCRPDSPRSACSTKPGTPPRRAAHRQARALPGRAPPRLRQRRAGHGRAPRAARRRPRRAPRPARAPAPAGTGPAARPAGPLRARPRTGASGCGTRWPAGTMPAGVCGGSRDEARESRRAGGAASLPARPRSTP